MTASEVSAARERLARFEQRATAFMQERVGAHAINVPVTREDIEAMRVIESAVSALQALDTMLKRDGLPTLRMRGERSVGIHASLGYFNWPNPLAEVVSRTTAGDAIQALAAELAGVPSVAGEAEDPWHDWMPW